MLKKALENVLSEKESNELISAFDQIGEIIKKKAAIYDLKVDKTINKIGNGSILKKFELSKLPEYIVKNQKKFLEWMD